MFIKCLYFSAQEVSGTGKVSGLWGIHILRVNADVSGLFLKCPVGTTLVRRQHQDSRLQKTVLCSFCAVMLRVTGKCFKPLLEYNSLNPCHLYIQGLLFMSNFLTGVGNTILKTREASWQYRSGGRHSQSVTPSITLMNHGKRSSLPLSMLHENIFAATVQDCVNMGQQRVGGEGFSISKLMT